MIDVGHRCSIVGRISIISGPRAPQEPGIRSSSRLARVLASEVGAGGRRGGGGGGRLGVQIKVLWTPYCNHWACVNDVGHE